MNSFGGGLERGLGRAIYLLTSLTCLIATASLASTEAVKFEGWELERDVETPSYAVIDPANTNLNVDSIVLACEQVDNHRGLQLQVFLSTEELLLPNSAVPQWLKQDPRAEVAIDGRVFPVELIFAEGYAVLADGAEETLPLLSKQLLDAMQAGKIMILRFDLVVERAGQPPDFDGEVWVDLQAGAGGTAVAAVRHCAAEGSNRPGNMASVRPGR